MILVPQPAIELQASAVTTQNHNNWTTREFLHSWFQWCFNRKICIKKGLGSLVQCFGSISIISYSCLSDPAVKVVKQMKRKYDFQEVCNMQGINKEVELAIWCGPCKQIKPAFQFLCKKYSNAMSFELDIAVGDFQDVASECKVKYMPISQLFKRDQRWMNFLELIGKTGSHH